MKLYHPACLGVFVALLSSLVASQEISMGGMEAPCSTIKDCPKDMYCSALSNTCLEMSKCNEVADCKDSTNIFASAMCMGTRFCEAGVCGIDCTVMPPEDEDVKQDVMPLVGTGECTTDSDCGMDQSEREPEMFCASDGICEPIAGCATVDDCFSESNVFPIATCMGGMECNDRKCFMNCIGSDALLACDTTADCLEPDHYCAGNGICLPMGGCDLVKDCSSPDNFFMMAECVGEKTCEEGSCGIKCDEFCTTSDDCEGEDNYHCAGNGKCLPMGGCDLVEDCSSPDNIFLLMADCVGEKTCEEGFCGMICDPVCTTSDDCGGDNYCAGNGRDCLPMGGCEFVEDCSSPDNFFMMAECVGEKTCEEGSCGIKCDEFCTTSDDCEGEDNYHCAGNGKCLPMGGCDLVEDCSSPDNIFLLMADCVGEKTCEEGFCGMICDPVCTTSDDCGGDNYCAGNGRDCLPMGGCEFVEDCSSPDNFFMMAECVGEKTCEEWSCGIKCDEFCTTSDDCEGEDNYCAGNGKCLLMGGCDLVEDCSSPDNFFMMAECVGEKTCEEGMCGIECDSTPGKEALPVGLAITCTQDSDCSITTSTTRSSEGAEYCAQGVCTKHGACMSDSDCHNPSNILWNDKRCAGYLHCTNEGMCDRVCGEECKKGSRAVECFTDPCSIDTCPGAASCYASICGCVAEYFNAAGEIVDCESQALGESKALGDDQSKDGLCTTSNDCKGEETYCAGNGKCLPMGACDLVEDCSGPDNSFMLAACVGEKTCEEGMCGIECDTGDSQKDTILSIDSSAIGSSVSLSAVLVAVLVAAVFV